MKLKYNFESVDMGDEIIAVPVGSNAQQVHGILKLNAEGQRIASLLTSNISEQEIIEILAKEYGEKTETIAVHVHRAIEVFRTNDLLEE